MSSTMQTCDKTNPFGSVSYMWKKLYTLHTNTICKTRCCSKMDNGLKHVSTSIILICFLGRNE